MNTNNLNKSPIQLDIHKILKQLNINEQSLSQIGLPSQQPSSENASASSSQKLVSSFS
ncbi:hypothetical protein [Paenibacillus sp. H1-7]|uniref:hypothetical protein n=1 Tax=Paenibacillus sp. H1-7 TaxID=2282849 RepID=UPI001EF8E433|nr:hypothetical protein [Paenibacillus sp. H1-7]